MRFQRLSKEGPHWWLRKLILKKRQSKTWNLTHGNVDLHRRPRRCRTKCNEGYIHPIFAKQQLNGPARGIRGSSLTFEIFQSSADSTLPRHPLSFLVIPRVPSVASCLVTSDVCPARKDFCPVRCDVCLVTRDFCLVSCHIFLGLLFCQANILLYLSLTLVAQWSVTILKRISQEFERPWDVCPSPVMVMNGSLALTLPPPHLLFILSATQPIK